MLNQVQEGISTGFELVTRNGESFYRVTVETYASTAQEAQAIAQRLRRRVENFERPEVNNDGTITQRLHCYCDDTIHTHYWQGEGWLCLRCGKVNN